MVVNPLQAPSSLMPVFADSQKVVTPVWSVLGSTGPILVVLMHVRKLDQLLQADTLLLCVAKGVVTKHGARQNVSIAY